MGSHRVRYCFGKETILPRKEVPTKPGGIQFAHGDRLALASWPCPAQPAEGVLAQPAVLNSAAATHRDEPRVTPAGGTEPSPIRSGSTGAPALMILRAAAGSRGRSTTSIATTRPPPSGNSALHVPVPGTDRISTRDALSQGRCTAAYARTGHSRSSDRVMDIARGYPRAVAPSEKIVTAIARETASTRFHHVQAAGSQGTSCSTVAPTAS